MKKNNKNSILLLIGLLIIIIVNILDKVIELNEFILIGLGLIALICFIIYLIKIYKSKRYVKFESIGEN